ncbi:hypothetical protein NC652_027840 [Populus alba x Populus x berolinensis]|uniref:Uncharacterized protein n=4 Tax=Populus TaxID=3689 RepID=A0ACC4BD21_POPAL|nr:uncharacterized protein LOC118058338 isoform X1 [Populus alba]KAJ6893888.1 hypothetical protein NC652_027840 [Populus alba x Populus x berolinensis]KAJ6979465.1 hypothetical protein NC653_027572 [Populus alba x Populus x berolinensis]KAJ6979468.1 hypothetical protein NC653_027575 [Populus alba x Populus x berolinensis]TKS05761.1 hypothetical protein D5086_0000129770 [Populus alba]
MEALDLLFSITSTFFTSLALSLILVFRTLFTRRPSSTIPSNAVSLYQGTVWHERRRPVHHSFRYSVRYALFDLDHAHAPPDHLSADEARQVAQTTGPVLLLTIPPSVGYEQNPLSLYYCYDMDGSARLLKKCIAEVTNTPWGERVVFIFDPNSDVVAKPLHVSPFMDMLGNWNIKANDPTDSLSVFISVQHPELGDYFVASLKAKRLSSVSDHAMFFWLMPHKVALWIYWHALKLWWKNVHFIQHPRYTNPTYREEAMIRDKKLQCNQALAWDRGNCLQADGHHPGNLADRKRWFKWRDAKRPWC